MTAFWSQEERNFDGITRAIFGWITMGAREKCREVRHSFYFKLSPVLWECREKGLDGFSWIEEQGGMVVHFYRDWGSLEGSLFRSSSSVVGTAAAWGI